MHVRTYIALILFWLTATSVFAQEVGTATPTTSPVVVPEAATPFEVPATRTRTRDDIEAARRVQHAPSVKDRAKNLLDNVTTRLAASADRLSRIADRIETRATALEALGSDVGATRTAVTHARTDIARARADLSRITELEVDLVVDDASPRARFRTLRDRVFAIRDTLMNAHRSLTRALSLLAQPAPIPTTTSTASTTP